MSGASFLPPLRWVGFWPVVRPLFFSLAFSGFARSGLGVSCWCFLLFSPPFFCVPRPGSLLGSCHLIVILISCSCSSHLPCCGRVCVCVYHLYRCKTSTLQGRVALMSYHTQRSCGHEWGKLGRFPVPAILYYIYSPAPGRI